MSDREFNSNDDLSLPKATVQKIITEILPPSSGQTFSKDARDLLMECCVEFITLISSEANEISEKEAKKTIACEHVEKALTELGFAEYVPEIQAVAEEHREQLKVSEFISASDQAGLEELLEEEGADPSFLFQSREKKQSKMEQSGLSEEELLRQQQELFRSATEKYNQGPE
ncbi:CBF/NF-Y family transcription factor [Penicillium argentinense]|uniref:NCT transcriptional regulatory complex subunit B n=1 Tax=Penicillium argentinense TaxID=1131581 RepID=A0A9W9KM87_9EURO|nr:CBF/NF-Y family transcription factor [Penicillium argentinense]KAJ5110627.1 CBF/NF-Y family transcription factor [Penicillium argentinense]